MFVVSVTNDDKVIQMQTSINIEAYKSQMRRSDYKIIGDATGFEPSTVASMINGTRTCSPDVEIALKELMEERERRRKEVIRENVHGREPKQG